MKLLILFISRPGEVITREEIAACLWHDSRFVEVASGINTAVNRLRTALGDRAAKPNYIETVVGLGYRFIAEVELTAFQLPTTVPSAPTQIKVEPATIQFSSGGKPLSDDDRGEPSSPSAMAERQPGAAGVPEMLAVPAGDIPQVLPAATAKPSDKRVWRKSAVVALVVTGVVGVSVVCGYLIRTKKRHGISTGLALAEFRQVTFTGSDRPVVTESVSHDGSMVAFSDGRSVSVRSLERGVDRKLLTPATLSIVRISWTHGDTEVLLSGRSVDTGRSQIWIAPLKTADPHLLLDDAADSAASPTTPRIVFTRKDGAELWIANSDGSGQNLLRKDSAPIKMLGPVWSYDGKRITCELRKTPVNAGEGTEGRQYQWQLDSYSVDTGQMLSTEKDVHARSASLTPDGHLYFTASPLSNENAAAGFFVVQTDPKTGRFLSEPLAFARPAGEEEVAISVSDTGKIMAALISLHSARVHAAKVDQRTFQLTDILPLIHPAPNNFPHAWTPSGDAVLFESDDQDKYAIYKQGLVGSPATVLARSVGGAVLPQVTPDGQWVLFDNLFKFHPNAIYRVPLEGGEIQELPTHGQTGDFQCSVSATGRCVLRKIEGRFISFYALDPLSGEGALLGKIDWVENAFGDWSLSPDGTTVAMPSHDNPVGIRLVTLKGVLSHTIAVPDMGKIIQAIWTPDARGFYMESQDPVGYTLSYVTLNGKVLPLRKSTAPIWGIPSRDGSRVAFAELERNTNVWIAGQ